MTNREKYKEELIDLAIKRNIFALVKGVPKLCNETYCENCDYDYLDKDCDCASKRQNIFKLWLNKEYVEPPIDWIKVAVDTPIFVRDRENETWAKRHFAKYENGKIYTWTSGTTSWSGEDDSMISWKYAKLATEEDMKND